MITLQEFFNTLSSGEFSSIAIGNSVLGSITEKSYPKIVNNMNLGLIEIYKRFTLKEKRITLYEQTDLTQYFIRSDYFSASIARVNDNAYLIDNVLEPFEDDLIRITEAYDADDNVIHINDKRYTETGIFTTSFDTIRLTPADPLRVITLVYLASYPKIIIEDGFDPNEIELYFPNWIQEPLLYYIAARIFQGKSSKAAEGERSLYTTFLYQYEASCKKIELLGLADVSGEISTNFVTNGWV